MGDFDNLMYALFRKKTIREREIEAREEMVKLKEREVAALEQLAQSKSKEK